MRLGYSACASEMSDFLSSFLSGLESFKSSYHHPWLGFIADRRRDVRDSYIGARDPRRSRSCFPLIEPFKRVTIKKWPGFRCSDFACLKRSVVAMFVMPQLLLPTRPPLLPLPNPSKFIPTISSKAQDWSTG